MKLLAALILFFIPALCWSAGYQSVGSAPFVLPARRTAAKPARTAAPSSSSRVYVGKDGSLLLFGTVELGRQLKTLPKWTDVVARNAREPIFQPEKYFNKTTTWQNLKDRAAGKTAMQQLQLINEFWNKWKYKTDESNWQKEDYWAIPAQFIKRSGDCEDYAIVKYFTLKELGFDPHDMRIVVLRNSLTGEGHAVLAVYLDNDIFILDNLSHVVLSHKRLTHYEPQFSVNEFRGWQHLRPLPKKK